MSNRSWKPIIERAKQIVLSYTFLITLRQLHYRLVAEAAGGYRNTDKDYDQLSKLTAEARRDGAFPAFVDQTRSIHRLDSWASPNDALADLATWYRRDRTEGQSHQIWLGGEKATMLGQLAEWYDDYGFPLILLRGYGSQTYLDNIADEVQADGRPALLVYAGDFDASGVDILRDFQARCPVFTKVEQVALLGSSPDQITSLRLPVNQGKGEDSRADLFRKLEPKWARYADRRVASTASQDKDWAEQYTKATKTRPRLLLPNVVQVEVEAIDPNDLKAMYQTAIDQYWDQPTYQTLLRTEKAERQALADLSGTWTP